MAVLLPSLPESGAEEVLPHKTWTREELLLIEGTGVFEGTHFELIEGELIDKMGKKPPHNRGVRRVVILLGQVFGPEQIQHETPIDVASADNARNEPEPDVVVLRRSFETFERNAAPQDIVMVVEVADTSLRTDLETKSILYARAGIADYWVLDVKKRVLHVFRQPAGDLYLHCVELREDEAVSPLERPQHSIPVASLFG